MREGSLGTGQQISRGEPELAPISSIRGRSFCRVYTKDDYSSIDPSAATVLLEWTNRHMEMAAVDAKHVLADTQEIMEIGLRLLPGGWLFNGKGRGSSISAAAAGFPFPASPCGMAQDRVCLRIKGNEGK